MVYNKEKTKQRIYDALVHIISEQGFQAVGINAVAREAGVNKNLIYRYFGGLEELLKKYAEEGDFWPHLSTERIEQLFIDYQDDLPGGSKAIVIRALRELRARKSTQEIIRWELVDTTGLSKILTDYRNEQIKLMVRPEEKFETLNMSAIGTLMSAAINHLVLVSKNREYFYNINLQTDAGWAEIEDGIRYVYDAIFEKLARDEPDYLDKVHQIKMEDIFPHPTPAEPAPKPKRTRKKAVSVE